MKIPTLLRRPRLHRAALWFLLLPLLVGTRAALSAPFTPGNLVVVRVGDGSAVFSSTAAPVFLDEYNITTGVLVQSFALPATAVATMSGNAALTIAGSSGAEGFPGLSTNGMYLSLTGYNASSGTAAVGATATALTAATNNRIVGRVAADGTLDTSTRLGDGYSTASFRSAISTDGSGFWTGGAAGVRYVSFANATGTATTVVSTTPGSNRVVGIANGQLYISASTSVGPYWGVTTVGSGLPIISGSSAVTPAVITTGNTALTSGVYQYAFFDLDPTIAGVDVVYLADAAQGKILKYTFDGTTWTAAGSIAQTSLSGLTAVRSATSNAVTFYATSTTVSTGNILKYTDPNTTITGSITGLTPTTFTAGPGTNKGFRGLAFAPEAAPAPQIFVSTAGTLNAGTTASGSAGTTVVSYDVSGRYLTAAITVTAPANYEVSLSSGSGFAASVTTVSLGTAATGGLVATTRIYVRLKGTGSGTVAGNVTNVSGTASQNVAVTGSVTGSVTPTISVGPLTPAGNFSTVEGTASAAKTYTLTGSNLTGTLDVGPLAGYEFSTDGFATAGAASLSLTPSGGAVSVTVSVRLTATATAAGSPYNGNINNVSTGATTQSVAVMGTVTLPTPTLTASPTTLSGFSYVLGSGPSASQSFNISGVTLTGAPGNLTVAGSTNYEVSADNVTFGATASVPYATATLAATPVYVRLKAGLPAGPYNGETITVSGGGAATNATVTVSGTVVAPSITVTGTLAAFNTLAGSPSAPQSLTVSGAGLSADIILTAPTGYELSTNGGTTYAGTGTLTASGGTVTATTVRLRLTGLTPTASLGTTLQIRSTGAANQDQTTSGTVVAEPVAPAPTVAAGTPTASTVVLTLTPGTGTNLLVVVRQSGTPAVPPTDAFLYTMAAGTYGSTTGAGSTGAGNYVIFVGPNATTSTTVYGLAGGTSYVADVYSYNVGTANGFENYNPAISSSAVFTTLPASALLLEEDFDYPAGTVLANNNTMPSTLTGWKASSGNGTNNIATATGNLAQPQYPQGAVASTTSPVTSSKVSIITTGQDIAKPFAPAASLGNIYYTALVNVSAAQANGDYFLHLVDNGTASVFRGRVFVRSTAGGINFGVSIAGTISPSLVYSPTVYQLSTPYLLVMKYATNGTSAATDDVISLFVFDNTATPATEPTTATVTAGPDAGISVTQLNAVALRQGTAGNAPTLTVDNIRVATDYGTAVGRPSYTTAGARIGAGNYYDLTLNNADQLTPVGAVSIENTLNLTSGLLNTTVANSLRLYVGVTVTGGSSSSFVNGPLLCETAVSAATTLFPIGKGTAYRPLTLNAAAQTSTTTYTGEVLNTSARTTGVDAPLDRVSNIRYATLTPDVQPTGFSGTLTMEFGADDYVTDPQDITLVMAKRDGAANWFTIGRSSATGTAGSGNVAGTLTSGVFTSFSDFALASTAAAVGNSLGSNPLPVELTAFSAQRQADKAVSLKWATASERNSARFEVQRSLDGREFATFATAVAQGNSTHATAYAALDKVAPAGTLYYRLRQVDRDGSSSFSPVAIVAANGEVVRVLLYPNPAHSTLRFVAPTAQAYRVLNQLGQPLLHGTTEAGPAAIAVETLPTGLYFLELQTAAGRVVQKFEKE